MTLALLADIHGNLQALEAVLEDIERQKVEAIYCLGDIVGYGADPNACCAIAEERFGLSLLGNHDDAVLGRTPLAFFNPYAAEAILYTQRVLEARHRSFLEGLPYVHATESLFLTHATPFEPRAWHYLDAHNLHRNLPIVGTRIGAVGHSHLQGAYVFSEAKGNWIYLAGLSHEDEPIPLGKRGCIVVVGGVGQPRDGDPRAAYTLLDVEAREVRFRRCPYDIGEAQRRIMAAGLPPFLAARLSVGR